MTSAPAHHAPGTVGYTASASGAIDLGELPPAGWPEPTPVWSTRNRWRQLARRRPAITATALAVLLLLILTGTPAPDSALRLRLEVAAISIAIDGTHLYTIEPAENDLLSASMTAYRLADGAVAWQTDLTGQRGAYHFLTGEEGALLLMVLPHRADSDRRIGVTRLDPATGESLWHVPGWVQGMLPGLLVIRAYEADDYSGAVERPAAESTGFTWLGVDLETGQQRWRIGPIAGYPHVGVGETDWILTLHDGEMITFDPRDGAELRRAEIVEVPADVDHVYVQLVGETIALLRHDSPDGPDSMLYGYDLHTLEWRWTTALADGYHLHYAQQCGALLCLFGQGTPQALDPETGQVRWVADRLPSGIFPHYVGPSSADPLSHYVVMGGEGTGGNHQWLLSADTGKPVLELPGWRLVPDQRAHRQKPLAWAVSDPRDGVTLIGRLRDDLTGVDVIGEVDRRTEHCSGHGRYLVCGSGHNNNLNDWVVWQLRSGAGS